MEAREFREAIAPIIEQYARDLFNRPGRRSAVDTLIKRQTTQAIRDVVYPIQRQISDAAIRQRDLYS